MDPPPAPSNAPDDDGKNDDDDPLLPQPPPSQPPAQTEFRALRAVLAAAIKALQAAPVPPLVKRKKRDGDTDEREQEQEQLDVVALGRAVLAALPPEEPAERARWAAEGTSIYLGYYDN